MNHHHHRHHRHHRSCRSIFSGWPSPGGSRWSWRSRCPHCSANSSGNRHRQSRHPRRRQKSGWQSYPNYGRPAGVLFHGLGMGDKINNLDLIQIKIYMYNNKCVASRCIGHMGGQCIQALNCTWTSLLKGNLRYTSMRKLFNLYWNFAKGKAYS